MFNETQIKEHMEVVGADGVAVGTVHSLEGDRLNITKADKGQRPHKNRQHYLAANLISRVEDNKVRLSANGDVPTQFEETLSSKAQSPFRPANDVTPAAPAETPFWNWNKIGAGVAAVAAAGAAGAAFLNRKPHTEDDFERRLETDENVRLISSEKVEGTPVIGRNGETLGQINSFMVDKYTGRVAYAIMTFGGTMGFGNSFFPLPWPLLDYDVEKDGYVLDITKEQLAKAPRFDGSSKSEFTPDYRRKLILFYRS
jgi:hypothetical protein